MSLQLAIDMIERFTGQNGRQLIIDALRSQPVIGEDADLAEAIYEYAKIVGFEPGSTIIQESAPDNDICFILAGAVSIRVHGREVAIRKAGQHVGEMALVDPGQPRSASVVAKEEVVIARVSEAAYTNLAESNPRLWRNIARELAARLRERNQFIPSVNETPVLFVGCSVEALPIARAVQSALAHDPIVVKVWTDDTFEASSFPIESLEKELMEVDFAALVISPDDKVLSRNSESAAPRDNLILEIGLFMGALGHSRTFLLYPRGVDVKLPTDLKGLTPLTYSPSPESQLPASVADACNKIRNLIQKNGPR